MDRRKIIDTLNDKRVYVNGETAIKPYLYIRNDLIHIRYTVDRCTKLSKAEAERIKKEITGEPARKQDILLGFWKFLTGDAGHPIIMDGIAEIDRRIEKLKEGK